MSVFEKIKPLPYAWFEDQSGNKTPIDLNLPNPEEIEKSAPVGTVSKHFIFPQVTESMFIQGNPVPVEFNTTINSIEDIVLLLITRHRWKMTDAIVYCSQLCSRCLNILAAEATGTVYQEKEQSNTYCEQCDVIDPVYSVEYKKQHASGTGNVADVTTVKVASTKKRYENILRNDMSVAFLKFACDHFTHKIESMEEPKQLTAKEVTVTKHDCPHCGKELGKESLCPHKISSGEWKHTCGGLIKFPEPIEYNTKVNDDTLYRDYLRWDMGQDVVLPGEVNYTN